MALFPVGDPQRWHQCAQEARILADAMVDPGAKKTLLEVAASYDEMARCAEHQSLPRPAAAKP